VKRFEGVDLVEYRACRICRKQDDTKRLFKYAVRSYAHHKCILSGKSIQDGFAWVRALPSHELRRFPVFHFQDWYTERGGSRINLIPFFKRTIREAKKREAS
jgi:hypothetical protein